MTGLTALWDLPMEKVKVAQSCPTLCDPMESLEFSRPEYWSGSVSLSRGSSQPRDRTQVSHREAQEYWRGEPIPSPADLPDPGIKQGSPASQADSSPTKLSGKQDHEKWNKSVG